MLKAWRRWREQRRREHEQRADAVAFEQIITANYRRNYGRVLPGRLPVIAPRPEDFVDEREDFYREDLDW